MSNASLEPLSADAMAEFRGRRDEITLATVDRALQQPEVAEHLGTDAERILKSGIGFTCQMLEAAMETGHSAILTDEVDWAIDRLPHDNVPITLVIGNLKHLDEAIHGLLSEETANAASTHIQFLTRQLSARAPHNDH